MILFRVDLSNPGFRPVCCYIATSVWVLERCPVLIKEGEEKKKHLLDRRGPPVESGALLRFVVVLPRAVYI